MILYVLWYSMLSLGSLYVDEDIADRSIKNCVYYLSCSQWQIRYLIVTPLVALDTCFDYVHVGASWFNRVHLHMCTGDDLLWACSHCCSMQGGHNAFHMCAVGGHLAVAKYLAPKLKDHLFDSDDVGYTALHWAAQGGQLSMVEFLVKSCEFDVKAVDKVLVWCFCDLSAWAQ